VSKRFEKAVAGIREPPDEEQDRVAALIMELVAQEDEQPALTPEQVAGVYHALEQVQRREFASGENVECLVHRP
jgi:hypothetical protein